jgi:hypothetical protein
MHRDNLGTMYHVRELTSKYQREISSVAPAAVHGVLGLLYSMRDGSHFVLSLSLPSGLSVRLVRRVLSGWP